MKLFARILAVLSIVAALYFVIRPADRMGVVGDGGNREGCVSGLSVDDSPVRYSLSLISSGLFYQPIDRSIKNWGTCPYSYYKHKSVAIELWLVGGLAAYYGFGRAGRASAQMSEPKRS